MLTIVRSFSELNFNDLYRYDTSLLLWTNLSIPKYGTPPSPRYDFGFDFVVDKIYLFGGFDDGRNPLVLTNFALAIG